MTYIVIEGDVVSGLSFHGPFDTQDEATAYGDKLNEFNRVVSLLKLEFDNAQS